MSARDRTAWRKGTRASLYGVLTAMLVACNRPDSVPPPPLTASGWSFDASAATVRRDSCPNGEKRESAGRLQLKTTAILLSGIDAAQDLPGATFAGGWHLSSSDPAFGGLSGLTVNDDGNLLAVSDQGAFVWIDLVDDRPAGALVALMRDADGGLIASKRLRDAEGLDLHDGIALVSFEREHRIVGFDLAGCGAAARGVEVARLGDRIAGMQTDMKPNGGAEGLSLTANGELFLAVETTDRGLPLARVDESGAARVAGRIEQRGEPVLTGLDRIDDTFYAVLRSYAPGTGNTIEVVAFPASVRAGIVAVQRILRLEPRHGTDNFEGIALQRNDGGGVRLWLISDDNFSRSQRTLLYAFDLALPDDHHLAL